MPFPKCFSQSEINACSSNSQCSMFNEKSLNFSINQFRLLLFEVKGHISCLIQNFSGCLIAGTYLLSTQQILTRDGQTRQITFLVSYC